MAQSSLIKARAHEAKTKVAAGSPGSVPTPRLQLLPPHHGRWCARLRLRALQPVVSFAGPRRGGRGGRGSHGRPAAGARLPGRLSADLDDAGARGPIPAVDGGHGHAHGPDRAAHCGGQRPGDRGHRQDAASADAHQPLHHLPGQRRPGHGAARGALRGHHRGVGPLGVRLLLLRVLDVGGRPVCHRQHRDAVCHRPGPLHRHHVPVPLPEPADPAAGAGARVHRVGHLGARVLPAHPHALVAGGRRRGAALLQRPQVLRLCHQPRVRHRLLRGLLLRAAVHHGLRLPARLPRGAEAGEEDRPLRAALLRRPPPAALALAAAGAPPAGPVARAAGQRAPRQAAAVAPRGPQGAEGAQDAGHHHGRVHPLLAALLPRQRGEGLPPGLGAQLALRLLQLAGLRQLGLQPHHLLPQPGLPQGLQAAPVLPAPGRAAAPRQRRGAVARGLRGRHDRGLRQLGRGLRQPVPRGRRRGAGGAASLGASLPGALGRLQRRGDRGQRLQPGGQGRQRFVFGIQGKGGSVFTQDRKQVIAYPSYLF